MIVGMVKKTEIRLVASLLETEAEDTGELAARIIEALDEKRRTDDVNYTVMWQHLPMNGQKLVGGYGPFPTPRAAKKCFKQVIEGHPSPTAARVVKLAREVRDTP